MELPPSFSAHKASNHQISMEESSCHNQILGGTGDFILFNYFFCFSDRDGIEWDSWITFGWPTYTVRLSIVNACPNIRVENSAWNPSLYHVQLSLVVWYENIQVWIPNFKLISKYTHIMNYNSNEPGKLFLSSSSLLLQWHTHLSFIRVVQVQFRTP